MANKTLGELIEWLEKQPQDKWVRDGFGSPHSDRGDYSDCAFDPKEGALIEDMLRHAKSALGTTFKGWKGGNYVMEEYVNVLIGEHGHCGENITDTHFKHWEQQF